MREEGRIGKIGKSGRKDDRKRQMEAGRKATKQ